ncbi:hypothetical protein HDV04_006114 [Boothiomyces sp. JEL0838]|nr:hypothetical protein HDV04_006114 [Boothiomyces sp. JEL0838]
MQTNLSDPVDTDQTKPEPQNETLHPTVYVSMVLVYRMAKQMLVDSRHQSIQVAKDTLKMYNEYLQKYPALKTFVYTTGALSIVPVGIFTVFFVFSLLFSISTAVIGVLIVQASLAFLGLTVLVPVEIGILFVAGGTTMVYQTVKNTDIKVVKHYESLLIKEKEDDDDIMVLE